MMNGANLQIVDDTGHVHHRALTSEAADGLLSIMMGTGKFHTLRIERMDAVAPVVQPEAAPPIVAMANPTPLPSIDVRQALRVAIEARNDAAGWLADASQAVDRATVFRDDRQAHHAAATISHEAAIRAAAATIAEAFKAGGTVAANRVIDRAELVDADAQLSAANAAVELLQTERGEAERQLQTAEAGVNAAVLAVKRVEVEVLVDRLEVLKAEFIELAGRVDGAGFSGIVLNARAKAALHVEANAGEASTNAARWHGYTKALRESADATWGGVQ
ncbi:protein of unknown function [Ralstonia solanacearum CMR15]|nr:protein of unknown function [Ralstonia solanacearum CMR15]